MPQVRTILAISLMTIQTGTRYDQAVMLMGVAMLARDSDWVVKRTPQVMISPRLLMSLAVFHQFWEEPDVT